jgi:nitroreductase
MVDIMFAEIISARRSVRKFTADPVPQGDMVNMLKFANYAPSGGNRRPWRFVVVTDKPTLEGIKQVILQGIDALPDMLSDLDPKQVRNMQKRYRAFSLFFADAPVTIFVAYDTSCSTLARMFESRGLHPEDAEHQAGLVEVQGTAAAIENFLLAAQALGYGACWMDPPYFAREEITTRLDILPPLRLLAMIPVGRPADKPHDRKRNDLAKIVRYISEKSS